MLARALLLIALPAAFLAAQGKLAGDRPRRDLADRPFRARIMARLHEIRAQRIQQSLGVPEAKATAIADRWGRFDQESMDRRQGMRAARQQVQDALMGPGTEEEKNNRVRPAMDQYSALHKQQQEARAKFEEDLKGMLTPAQQGRFILLMEEFQRSIQESLPERRREK